MFGRRNSKAFKNYLISSTRILRHAQTTWMNHSNRVPIIADCLRKSQCLLPDIFEKPYQGVLRQHSSNINIGRCNYKTTISMLADCHAFGSIVNWDNGPCFKYFCGPLKFQLFHLIIRQIRFETPHWLGYPPALHPLRKSPECHVNIYCNY
ncbi:hypothetical protein LSH36_464g00014 [Paralvinella palmiformis]|uniref:Uncharacterized protein n=1 Tax=Paralvinella palmiformis TaxID=53620 RepID=A0AAD9JAE8_9ANNE|nr:hypothetical protein LSH36_464g00014 [Paralvinella palmiformis]